MNQIRIIFAIIPMILFLSCKTNQNVAAGKEAFTPEMQKKMTGFPEIIGFERRAIFPEKMSDEQEKNLKIEIFPGRELYVDCNRYGLQGEMLQKTFENGNSYYLFNTNGEIFSTRMACPDETRETRFVTGESVLTDYSSQKPVVVYTSQFLQVKYSLWKGGEEKSVSTSGNGTLATEEALENAKYYPDKAGFIKHMLFLPELEPNEEINRNAEIILCRMTEDHTKNISLKGKTETGILEGYGFEYWVFIPERKPESGKNEAVLNSSAGETSGEAKRMVAYNSRLPVVVYTPEGFGVNYKIWETNGKMY